MNTIEQTLFEETAEKLAQLHSLMVFLETIDLTSINDRDKGAFFGLAVALSNDCEDFFYKLNSESETKIKELEQQIKQQNQIIDTFKGAQNKSVAPDLKGGEV